MSVSDFEYRRLAKERQAYLIREAELARLAMDSKRVRTLPQTLKSLLLLQAR